MPSSLTICVDASLVVRVVAIPEDQAVQGLWRRWQNDRAVLIAPGLLRYEVTNALNQYHKLATLDRESLREALAAALRLPIRYRHGARLHRRAFELAARFSLPAAYDAHYLARAQRADAQFWTADRRPARAVQGSLPWVHLVGEAA